MKKEKSIEVLKAQTISERLIIVNFRPSGFDYLRLLLSLAVICAHSIVASQGAHAYEQMFASPLRAPVRLILPLFFALSGFLVAGSLERSKTIVSFLGLRAIRIYPALGVEVLLSAFLLGPILTEFGLLGYFSDATFRSYLLNVIGDVHFALPGVFLHNPLPSTINAQLWTVPYELQCYAVLAVLALMRFIKIEILAPLAGVALTLAFGIHHFLKFHSFYHNGPVAGPTLVVSFLYGVTVYLYRSKIPYSPKFILPVSVTALALAGIIPAGELLLPIFAAYMVVLLGLLNPRKIRLIRGADYSYGMFLYSFVIQQAFTTLGPWTHHWYINILFCVPISAAFAAFSWHFVERPALGLRARVMSMENWWLSLRKAAPSDRSNQVR